MRHIFKTTALAALLLVSVSAAQAAIQTYSFNGALESGALIGESYLGQFSFEDTTLTLTGEEYLGVNSLNMSFLSSQWGLAQLEPFAVAEVKFVDGTFAGLSYSASLNGVSFSTIPGFADATDAYVAYRPATGFEGTGTLTLAPVPEPTTYAMLLAGLALMGTIARRRKV